MHGPHSRRAAVYASLIIALRLLIALLAGAGGQSVRSSTVSGPRPQDPSPPTKALSKEAAQRSFGVKVINGQTGLPEPGVTVRLSLGLNMEGATDAEGRFRVPGSEREPAVLRLVVQKGGFVPLEVIWDNARAEVPVAVPREYSITIEPGSTIGGIVRDELGQPVEGARVGLSIPISGNQRPGEPRVHLTNHVTNTDANGRWQCDMVPAGLNAVSISLEHAEYLVERVQYRSGMPSQRELAELKSRTAVVVLRKGLTLEGRVINSEGNPIANADLSLSRSFRRAICTTDDQGRFELDRVPPGRNEVAIRAKGYVPALKQVDAAAGMAQVEVRLEDGGTVSGRVVDEDNKPVAGAVCPAPVRGFATSRRVTGKFRQGRSFPNRWDSSRRGHLGCTPGTEHGIASRRAIGEGRNVRPRRCQAQECAHNGHGCRIGRARPRIQRGAARQYNGTTFRNRGPIRVHQYNAVGSPRFSPFANPDRSRRLFPLRA